MREDGEHCVAPGPVILLRETREQELVTFTEFEREPDTAPFILPYSLEEHKTQINQSNIRYLTICQKEDKCVMGFMTLILEQDQLGLKRMVIGPKGCGFGQAALKELDVFCRQSGYRRIWLDVFADNACARHVYQKAGYHQVQEADFFGRSLLIYEKDLI